MLAWSHVPRRECSIEWPTNLEISRKFRGCAHVREYRQHAPAHGLPMDISIGVPGETSSHTRTTCPQKILEGKYAVQNASSNHHHRISSSSFRGQQKPLIFCERQGSHATLALKMPNAIAYTSVECIEALPKRTHSLDLSRCSFFLVSRSRAARLRPTSSSTCGASRPLAALMAQPTRVQKWEWRERGDEQFCT